MSGDWTEINREIREIETEIERQWADFELESEARDQGDTRVWGKDRGITPLFIRMRELLRQRKEIETGRITT